MKRDIYAKLLEWQSRRDHKPLVLGHDIYHIGLYETFPGFIHFSRKKINFVSS